MKNICLTILTCFYLSNTYAQPMIPEQAVPNLPDIAIATYTQQGFPIVYYNPNLCAQAGQAATLFFKWHEQGHHHLGHVFTGTTNRNPYVQYWLNRTAETDADLYATNYWASRNVNVIRGWCRFMWDMNNGGDNTHPPARVRVQNVLTRFRLITGADLQF